MIYQLKREQHINCSLSDAWAFFSTPKNLDKLTPDSVGFKITHCSSETAHEGQMIGYKVKVAPFIWVTWLTEITKVNDMHSFVDDQRIGPYKVWHHTHRFEEKDGGVLMTDEVTYVMPFGIIGTIVHGLFVKNKLRHIFDERKRLCEQYFSAETASAS